MMRTKLALSAAVYAAFLSPISASAAEDISISTSIDLVSDYVFRGVSLADTAIQPGVEMAIGGFSAGAWFSTGMGGTSVFAGDELDLYVGYDFALSNKISAGVGGTYYHYPQGGSLFSTNGGGSGTYEISAGLEFDTALAPSITAYYDFTLEAFTVEGGLEHSVPLGDNTSFDLGLTAGLVDGDGFSYEYAQASASVGYGFTDDVSAYIGANFALSSDETLNYSKILTTGGEDSLLFFGAGLAAGF